MADGGLSPIIRLKLSSRGWKQLGWADSLFVSLACLKMPHFISQFDSQCVCKRVNLTHNVCVKESI